MKIILTSYYIITYRYLFDDYNNKYVTAVQYTLQQQSLSCSHGPIKTMDN